MEAQEAGRRTTLARNADARSWRTPFRDNVVVITGASDGIGREMALQLAEQGAWLALAARDAAKLEPPPPTAAPAAAAPSPSPRTWATRRSAAALIDRTVEEFGRVDTLVNNAGISMWARLDEVTDLAPFETMMQVNYMGSVWCTHAALPHLKRSRGRIVGVSSLTGLTGVPTRSGYAASKHAMAGFFDSAPHRAGGRGRLGDDGLSRLRQHRHPHARLRARRPAAGGEPRARERR